jgi:hypothetical protein
VADATLTRSEQVRAGWRLRYIDRIVQALDSRAPDPKRFEETACALLTPLYPGLSPIEGGTDFGRDADIYTLPSAPRPDMPEALSSRPPGAVAARLLATTGDPIPNLDRSLRRLHEEGLETTKLVIACSLPVSGTKRRGLEERCVAAGLDLPDIYGRSALVQRLVKEPNWTEYLLGVRGRITALAPGRTRVVETVDAPLIGRDEAAGRLLSAVASDVDVVLTGVAGVGKSRLLDELNDVHFLNPLAMDDLVADIWEQAPSCVVVDDAHLHQDPLQQVCRVRDAEGMTFTILAVTWPAQLDQVRRKLRTPDVVAVRELHRDAMDEIVRNEGVSSVRARHFILDHAAGRPGWGLALARTLVSGNGEDVARGSVLVQQVERYVRNRAESEVLLDVVAHIAALRSAAPEDLLSIARIAELPYATMMSSLRQMATDGLLVESSGSWSLQPGLGVPLVANWFLGGAPVREWGQLLTDFPDRAHDLTLSLLQAAERVPNRETVARAHAWAAQLDEPGDWTIDTTDLVRAYSAIDKEAAVFAARAANQILAGPREVEHHPWRDVDVLGIAALGQLTYCTQRWFTEEAVHGMLTQAITDDRPRPQNTDHPMRVLSDMVQHLGPDGERHFEVRELLVKAAESWLAEDVDDPARVTIWAEALTAACWPHVSGTWHDPANYRSFTFSSGTETPEALSRILELWGRATTDRSPLGLPIEAIEHFLKLWDEWVRVAAGVGNGNHSLTEDQRTIGATGAWTFLRYMHARICETPGLALRVTQSMDLCTRWDVLPPDDLRDVPLDEELVLLAGRRDIEDEDVHAWMEKRDAEVDQLAQRLAAIDSMVAVQRVEDLAAQAQYLRRGDGLGLLGYRIAAHVKDPQTWLRAALKASGPELVTPLLMQCRERGLHDVDGEVLDHLQDPELRPRIVAGVLSAGTYDRLATEAIAGLKAEDALLVEHNQARNADDIVLALLNHPVEEIAGLTALGFDVGTNYEKPVPEELRSAWNSAFLAAASLSSRTQGISSYRITEALTALVETDPELCATWFERAFTHHGSPHDLENAASILSRLPRDARKRLATNHTTAFSINGDLILLSLIGHDPDLASELLNEGSVDPFDVVHALAGHLDEFAIALAPILLENGVSPDDIAFSLTSSRFWEGNESDDILRIIAWFDDAASAHTALRTVSEAAIPRLESQRLAALEKEEQEAVRGFL